MKKEELFDAVGEVDDGLLYEAEEARRRRKSSGAGKWIGAAACAAVVLVGAGVLTGVIPIGGSSGPTPGKSGQAGEFDHYAGPILPLTLSEQAEGLTARRELTLDFSADTRCWDDVTVSDCYTLTSSSDADRTVTALYPFVGSLDELGELLPQVEVDGRAAACTLYAGAGQPQTGMGWEDWQALLSDGSALADAQRETPCPDRPVTVYRLSGGWWEEPGKQPANPSVRATFTLDCGRTVVLSYGFSGGRYDWEQGEIALSYSISQREDEHYIIVIGDDLTGLTVETYATGGTDTRERITGGAETQRRETTLGEALPEVLRAWLEQHDRRADERQFALYASALYESLEAYDLLTPGEGVRGFGSMLEDLDFGYVQRVFYLAFPVTVPAGGTAQVQVTARHGSSYCYNRGRGEDALRSYDAAAQLGSCLTFTGQTAVLKDGGRVEITEQDFGFDPPGGADRAELDAEQERYRLTVRFAQ